MNTGTRIFEVISIERKRQVNRYTKAKQELQKLLQEYDLLQAAVLFCASSSDRSNEIVPRFVAESELVDLASGTSERLAAIDHMIDAIAKRSVDEACKNGDHLQYAANLILDEDRHSLELQFEIQTVLHECSDAIFRIQLLDRLILGLLNTNVDENASVSELVQTFRTALEKDSGQ